ncbi:hypothetical protein [Bizionia paragorgiae]|uniref:DUF7738 domain-containing protein n=1 Tax=Bizionia paragorgiae TaxID=283786 RepID=UPI003A923AE3
MKQIITIIISSILLIACNGKAQTVNNKAKDNNKVAQMLDAYQKQPHRIALNGCSFSYNEKPLKLETTIKELVETLGKYDSFSRGGYIWSKQGIVIHSTLAEEDINHMSKYIYIYMNTNIREEDKEIFKYESNIKKDYFLINGIPHRYDIYFSDFINHSTYDLNNDFGASNHNYFITKECDNGKRVEYTIDVNEGIWNYKEAGHLRLKNGLNNNNNTLIKYISIGYLEDKD